jgi:hypothetical protein
MKSISWRTPKPMATRARERWLRDDCSGGEEDEKRWVGTSALTSKEEIFVRMHVLYRSDIEICTIEIYWRI